MTMSCWALGSILGPCFGGLVAEPCTTWEAFRASDLCSNSSLLRKFPFVIPFGATAVLCAVSWIVGICALHPEAAVLAAWASEDEQQAASGSGGSEAQSTDAASVQDNGAVCHSFHRAALHRTLSMLKQSPVVKLSSCICTRRAQCCHEMFRLRSFPLAFIELPLWLLL